MNESSWSGLPDVPDRRAAPEVAAEAVKKANDEVRKLFGQEPSHQEVPVQVVRDVMNNDCPLEPEESWKRWKKSRLEAGWQLGKYDQAKKTHPNLIDKYDDLPFDEKVKDFVFWATIKAVLSTYDELYEIIKALNERYYDARREGRQLRSGFSKENYKSISVLQLLETATRIIRDDWQSYKTEPIVHKYHDVIKKGGL